MPIGRIRDLDKVGVITDIDAYNLPPNGFSLGVNVRFKNRGVERAPVFRTCPLTFTYASPRFAGSNDPVTGFDTVILGYLNGRVTSYKSGAETDISITGYVNADTEAPFTLCRLGDVLYVNRSDRVPWYMKTTDVRMSTLTNWDTNWRARLVRACSGALVAFGITKSGTYYPQMVKTSEFALANTVPSTWDNTTPGNNATENILAEMEGEIIDAQNFGQDIMIYGSNETWSMVMDSSENVWRYEKVFSDAGAISANCVVEVNKKHYVFGPTDIWVHDGLSKASLVDDRVREFIYNGLNLSKANCCFVVYDQRQKEIRFCYVSGDRAVAFTGTDGCNRAAVFNLVNETWTFDDLPNVYGGARANLDTPATWTTVTPTWDGIGGTYLDQEDSIKKPLVMVGDVNSTHGLSERLYAVDAQGAGSIVSFAVDTVATKNATFERDGIDLDELFDLKGYKVANSIYPQARLEEGAAALEFDAGANDYFNQAAVFVGYQTYDGDELYKLDFNAAGRFLSLRMRHVDYRWFRLTGIDIDASIDGDI